jgi:predicted FMN-binding regulatory protein PaiB
VLVKGRLSPVEDPGDKARILDAMMRKLQPEGGYEPITAGSPIYEASLKGVAVLALTPEEMTGKIKVGQKLTAKVREGVEKVLETRGSPDDQRTLLAMRTECGEL